MAFGRFTSENLTTAKQTQQGWLKTLPSSLTAISLPSPWLHVWVPPSNHAWIHTIICIICVVFFPTSGVSAETSRFEEGKESPKDTCQLLPDDGGGCVLRPPCKQVIKSRRRPGQARRCRGSDFIRCPLPLVSLTPHFEYSMCFYYLFYFFRLIHMLCPSIRCSSRSLPQEEPQSYLGYAGFDELKSHLTNSVCLCWE